MTHKLTRLLAMMLAIVMAFSVLLVPASAASYNDVSENAWYKAAVDYVQERGWMAGVSATSFAPKTEVTRGMMVTVLARVAGVETNNDTAAFTDTPEGKWYTGAAAWAAENGIVSGVGGGKFAPNRAITRQDLCVMLDRYLEVMGIELEDTSDRGFSDLNRVAEYALPAMIRCAGKQLISGYEDSTIRPKDTATRAQVAQLMMRLDMLVNHVADPMPAQSFNGEGGNGMAVSIEAPEGAFPEGTEMSVSAIENLQSIRVLEKLARTGTVYAASDISFTKKGETLQPNAPVQVQLSVAGLQDVENPAVVHVKHDGTVEYVDAELVSLNRAGTEKAMKFEATDFSVYAIVKNDDENLARLKVQLWKRALVEGSYTLVEDGAPVYVTRQDIDNLATIIPDGETPTAASGEMFCGWFYDDGAFNGTNVQYDIDDADGQHTMAAARDQVKARLQSAEAIVDNVTTVHIYPMLLKYFDIAYVDENGSTTLNTVTIFSKENSIRYEIYQLYTPNEQGYRFTGWQKDDGDDTVYQNHAEVAITNTLTTLRAQVEQGYWLTFEENPGSSYKGATYNAPIFCPYGNVPSNARPNPNPTLAGYDFGGWYTTYNNGTWSNPFNFNGTISQDTTLYAKWTLKSSVSYTLIVWRQRVDNLKTAADSAKTYDYAFSTTLDAAPNTNVSALDLSYFKAVHTYTQGEDTSDYGINTKPDGSGTWNNFFGFKYNSTHQAEAGSGYVTIGGGVTANNTKVLPNGSTVVNLYWDRELVTYDFVTVTVNYSRVKYNQLVDGQRYYISIDGDWRYITFNSDTANIYFYSDNGYTSGNAIWYKYTEITLPSSNTGGPYYIVYNDNVYTLSWYGRESGYYYWRFYDGSSYQYVRAGNNAYTRTEHDVYSKTETASSPVLTYTGLYNQKLDVYDYDWPDYVNSVRYRWYNDLQLTATEITFTSFKDVFSNSSNKNPDSVFHTIFYGYQFSGNAYVYHFIQNTDGSWPTNAKYRISTQVGNGMVFRNPQGFQNYQFRVSLPTGVTTYQTAADVNTQNDETTLVNPETHRAINGWTDWLDDGTYLDYDGNDRYENFRWNATAGGIEFRYTRNKYRIHYMVGKYLDGDGNEVSGPMAGQLKQSSTIYYEASIDSYKVGGTNYYNPITAGDFTDESFIFDGWYVDPGCTTAYDFTGKTMPLNGVTVYAKFIQRQYRVFLEPNFPNDPNFEAKWAESSQDLNFRVDYLGQISDGQPINCSDRNENYVLVGWYHDAACTEAYNFATRLTDEVADDYDKTTDMTDNIGTSSAYNADVNRPWINKKVVIYAKWRKVLPGANGITVKYDAIEQENVTGHTGTFEEENDTPTDWEDPLRYMDTATAYARSGSTPDLPRDWQFLYWEILNKDGSSTGITKYPGQEFTVDANYAVEKDITVNPDYGTRGGSNLVPVKAGETWVEYTASTIDTSKTYLIGFEVGSTVYLATNGTGYVTHSSDKHGYTAQAQFNGGKIVGVSGYTTDLADCQWNFSAYDTSSYHIKSAKNSNNYLYAYTNYSDLFVSSTAPYNGWYWSSTNHTLRYNNTRYASYYRTNSTNFMRTVTSSDANTTVKLYVQDSSGSGSSETVDYKKVTTPKVGVPYVIVSDDSNTYAITNELHPDSGMYNDSDTGDQFYASWLLAVFVTKDGDIIKVPEDEVSNVTWTAGSASAGYTWRNVGNSQYLAIGSGGYLGLESTEQAWLYDSNRYFNNQSIGSNQTWRYITFNTEDTNYYDYDTAKVADADAISIYARAYNLTVNYVMADGTTPPAAYSAQVAQGENYSVSVPSITGYTPNVSTVSGTMGTADVTETVTYTKDAPASYTVTFQDWDGTVLKTQTVTAGQAATAPTDPTRTGYTFTGWDVDFSNVTSDLVVTAQYEQNSSQGQGHWEWKPVSTIIPDEEYLIGWVKNGVTYLAVNYNESATNHYYYSLTSGGYNHYFGYTAVATIENNLVIGCTGNATNLDYCTWTFSSSTGGTITSGSDSNRYLAAYSSANYHDLYPAGADTYAQNWIWNADNKTLTRNIGGTVMYAQYSSLNNTGNYMGMYDDTEGEYVQLYHKEWVEDQVTLTHTVKFVDGYTNTIIAAHEVEDGDAMPATPAAPDHSGDNYQFVRWDPADPSAYTTVTEDLTFTAIYEFSQTGYYLVTFKDWNGRVLSTQTIAAGGSATAPPNPTRTGYNFTGWDKDYSSITQNLVVYATYSKTVSKSYTVTLRAVYGPKEPLKRTHVTWYANNGTTVTAVTEGETTTYTGDGVVYKNSNEVVINNGIDIEDQTSWANLTCEGATFLGWARLPEMADQVNANTPWFNGKFTTANVLDLGSDPENPTYTNKIIAYEGLSEKDLWLVYDAATNTFTAHDRTYNTSTGAMLSDTVTVTGLTNNQVQQIGANENQPYHGLYAVWKRDVFYVLHSSDGKLEAVTMPIDNTNGASVSGLSYKVGTADLTQFVRPGYLYGGYYTDKNNDGYAYGYVAHAAVQAVADSYTGAQLNGWTNVASAASAGTASVIGTNDLNTALASSGGFIEYNGASLYTNGTGKPYVKTGENSYMMDSATGKIRIWPNVWNGGDAETADGTALRPVPGKVYYLKEVHPQYLTSRMMYTYDTADSNKLLDVWVVTLLDDGNYKKNTDGANNTGFYVNVNSAETDKTAANFHKYDHLSATFTLTQQASSTDPVNHPAVSTTVKASDFGLEGGVVMVANMKDLAGTATTSFTMLPSWTTPDGAELFTWARSFDGTEKMFVDVDGGQEIGGGWATAEAKIWVRFYKEAGNYDSNCSEWVLAEKTGDGDIRALAVPAGSWKYFRIARFDKDTTPNGNNFWNATQQMTIRSSSNNGSPFENFVTKFWNNGTANDWGQYPTYTPVIINPS